MKSYWAQEVLYQNNYKTKGPGNKQIHNSFFNEVKPLLYTLRVLGRFPYHFTEDGIKPFSATSAASVYSVLLHLILISFTLRLILILIHECLPKAKNYNNSLQIFMLLSYLSQNWNVPIAYWIQAPRVVRYISQWSKYEAEFKKEFEPLIFRQWLWILSLFLLPVGLLHGYFGTYTVEGLNLCYAVVFLPVIYSSYAIFILWIVSLIEIQRQIKKLTKIVSEEGLTKVYQKRRCWLVVSTLTSATGDSQGMVCASLSISIFVAFIVSSYGFFTSLLQFHEKAYIEWQLGVPVLFSSLFFLAMFDIADRTSKLVGDNFSCVVLNMKYSTLNPDDLHEVGLLLISIVTNPPIIKYAGFLVVDRGLFISFISNTVTYLIFLIQFRH